MSNPMQFVQNVVRNNPQLQTNPQAQQMLNVIMSGDSVRGQQIAQNLCKSMGITPEDAVANAKRFFNMP